MGQYQQWLHYREVDQHLQAHLKELSSELAQLQAEQGRLPAPTASLANNAIIQALTSQRRYEHIQAEIIDFIEVTDIGEVPQTPFEFSPSTTEFAEYVSTNGLFVDETLLAEAVASVSSNALSTEADFAQNADEAGVTAQAYPEAVSPFISHALFAWSSLPNFDTGELPIADLDLPIPSTPHPAIHLLPEDMSTIIDEHSQTSPQLKLPWWLDEAFASSTNEHGHSPVDQQSVRTDRLVQRWLTRWGRETNSLPEQGEVKREPHKTHE
jgi:hypothetical protein